MPWHISKSDPRKVYDERHEVVCVCQTAEQAARIVAAVTGKAQEVIRLREPDIAGQHVAPQLKVSDYEHAFATGIGAVTDLGDGHTAAITPSATLDSFEPDTCCGSAISKAARSGVLGSVTSWECPKCGMEWQPAQVGSIRHWSPTPAVMIFRR